MTIDGYKQINISDFVNALTSEVGASDVRSVLPTFLCPLNKDIEEFYRLKAYEFDRQGISKTTLVFASYKQEPVLVGYYTLANKIIVVRKSAVSSNNWRRVKRFGIHQKDNNTCTMSAPLIGQLGKNYYGGYNGLISGSDLLQMAIDQVKQSQRILGGKLVYLECEDKPQLIDFYKSNNFYEFDRRPKDADECDIHGNELIQMMAYL